MCDVCEREKTDWVFACGDKDTIVRTRLFRVYRGQVARVNLCYLHAIELFCLGEKRFLQTHPRLTVALAESKREFL